MYYREVFATVVLYGLCSFGRPSSAATAAAVTARPDRSQTTLVPDAVAEPNLRPAVEKCRQYSKLQLAAKEEFFSIAMWEAKAKPQEFPHMALLGYGNTTDKKEDFKCGGSLISERWILTAAMCQKNHRGSMAKWVRLGDYDISSTTDIARPQDYRIVEYILHPEYKPRSQLYNDIALFRLEKDVEFSPFVRPICVNSDPSLDPIELIATGWGTTKQGQAPEPGVLSKVFLTNVPADECNRTYFSTDRPSLKAGILADSMICAGSTHNGEDACSGFGGGPLQVATGPDAFAQVGVTSFGFAKCGDKRKPGVYTRVSKYAEWIEQTAWPDVHRSGRREQ